MNWADLNERQQHALPTYFSAPAPAPAVPVPVKCSNRSGSMRNRRSRPLSALVVLAAQRTNPQGIVYRDIVSVDHYHYRVSAHAHIHHT